MLLNIFAFVFLFTLQPAFGVSKPKKAEVAFKHAEQLQKSSRYEEALLEFQDIEREFPYSKYAKLSKLKIADVHFDMSNYVQAQYQYQYYFDLYPKEPNSDYALFRVGYSMYKTLPKTIDRDLSETANVLKSWRTLLVKFPKSKYAKDILKYQKELLTNLGKKELYIAKFYLKQKRYISAQKRFNKLFKQFPTFKKNKKALEAAIKCARNLDDEPAVEKYSKLLKDLGPS
jgi:outer membrane protein assembly factor BamD